jgi:hypothetical protein
LLVVSCSLTRDQVVRPFHPKPTALRSLKLSSYLVRFWGWTENEREAAMDLTELRARAQQGLPLYGQSDQPEWVQQAAHSNSAFSQLKFCKFFPLNSQSKYLFLCLQRHSLCSFSPHHPRSSLIDTQAQPCQSPASWYGRVSVQAINSPLEAP